MGYHSDVRVITTVKGYDEIREKIEESKYKYLLNNDAFSVLKRTEKQVYFGWTYIKWYSSYEDVKFVEKALEQLKEPYRFGRLGEEGGDFETWFNDKAEEIGLPEIYEIHEIDDNYVMEEME